MTVAELGEHALIARVTARLPRQPWVVVGPGDDAAVIAPAERMLDVLTTDALVEGVHFDRAFCPPDAIGHKALAVNLSDLAAMGAMPRAALLSLILPGTLPVDDVDLLLDGMLALAARHKVAIVGGNITRSPGGLIVDVTAIGAVAKRRVLTRAGVRPGDEIYVTGTLGAGAAVLEMLQAGVVPEGNAADRYLRPEPRVRPGLLLGRTQAATACIDLSDGLGDGLRQLASASSVGMVIDAGALPVDNEASRWAGLRGRDPITAAIAGGDDYELLFTVRPSHRGRLRGARQAMGQLPITRIGVVTKGQDLVLRTAGGDRPLPDGFEHFR